MELPSPQRTYLTWAPASPCGVVARPPRRLQNGAAAVFGLEVSQWTAGPCWADWLSGFFKLLGGLEHGFYSCLFSICLE